MTGVPEVLWHGLRDSFLMAWEVWWALVLGFAISAIVQAWVPRERIQRRSAARASACRARDRPRGRLLVLQLRGDRDRQEPVSEGRLRRLRARVPVRLDEPRVRARARHVAADRLAVHAGRVRRRSPPDRVMTLLLRLFVSQRLEERGPRARPGGRDRPRAPQRRGAADDPRAPRQRGPGLTSHTTSATTGRWSGRRSRSASSSPGSSVSSPTASSTPCSSPTPHPGVKLIENALVGPLIAILSFVCSVGNIPLAAVLWSGGISFAGVIAFIFADLIVLPIIADLPQVLRRRLHDSDRRADVRRDGPRGADRRWAVRRRRPDPRTPGPTRATSSARSSSTTSCSRTSSARRLLRPVRADDATRRDRSRLRHEGRQGKGDQHRARRESLYFCSKNCLQDFQAVPQRPAGHPPLDGEARTG